MVVNDIVIEASVEKVFAVLSDPSTFPRWVVGAKEMRDVEPEWPDPGAKFHHTVGAGPVEIKDHTEVVEAEEPRRVVLEVRARPFMEAKVTFELERESLSVTHVTMSEELTGGMLQRVWKAPVTAALHLRNGATLARLKRFVESNADNPL